MPTKTDTRLWANYSTSIGVSGPTAETSNYSGPAIVNFSSAHNTFTGVENRLWKTLIRAGLNATTAANGSKYQRTGVPPQYYCFGYVNSAIPNPVNARRQSLTQHNVALFGAQVGSTDETSAINQARTKFAKKAENILTQFQGGVFLGELRETLHMIRRPSVALWRQIGLYLGVIRKNGRRWKKQPIERRKQWLSDTWLEYSLGWAPLLNDIDDACNYLQRRQDVLSQELIPFSAKAEVRTLRSESPRTFSAGAATLFCRERAVDTYTCVLAGAIASAPFRMQFVTASALGLSYRHFVPTLWEVLPWSFVIDYFTNIGDVLMAWSNQRTRLAWGRETVVRVRVADHIDQRGTNTLLKVVDSMLIPSTQRTNAKTFVRAPIDSPPVPMISFEIPGKWKQWVNMGALLNTRKAIGAYRLWV